MSYKSITTNDLTKKKMYDLSNFYNILPNLKNATSFDAWEVWFEKLALIDKHALIKYIKENKNSLDEDQLKFASWYLKKEL